MLNGNELISAFALCGTNPGEKIVKWRDNQCKALYLDRLGVNVNYVRRGMGGLMLKKANGVYDEVIDEDLILREYGFEVQL